MPPFTVASFATITHSRPSTTPIPVTIPAAGASPSYRSQAASAFSSRNGGAGIEEPVDPLAREELAARAVALDRDARRRPAATCVRALAQLGDERLHARAVRREVLARPIDARLEDHGRNPTAPAIPNVTQRVLADSLQKPHGAFTSGWFGTA